MSKTLKHRIVQDNYSKFDTDFKDSVEASKITFQYIQRIIIPLLTADLKLIKVKSSKQIIESKLDELEKVIRLVQLGNSEPEYIVHIFKITDYDEFIANKKIEIIEHLLATNEDSLNETGDKQLFTVLGNILNIIKNDKEKLNVYWTHIQNIYECVLKFQILSENTEA